MVSLLRASRAASLLANAGVSPIASFSRTFASLRPLLKDPERPKRPMSPWLSYLAEWRLSETAKSLTGPAVFKKAAAEWKTLPASDRRRFEEPHEKAKQEYDAAYKHYVESGKKDAWNRDPAKPRRPKASFMCFMAEFRQKNQSFGATELGSKGGEAWRNMSREQKAPYEKIFAANKIKYEADMKAYKASGSEEKWLQKVGIAAEREKAEIAKEKIKDIREKEKVRAAEKKQKELERAAAEKEKAKEKKIKEAAKLKKQKDIEKKKVQAAAKKAKLLATHQKKLLDAQKKVQALEAKRVAALAKKKA